MKPQEVSEILELNRVAKNHTWNVAPSCATSGDGIFEGLVCCRFPFRSWFIDNADDYQAWLSNHVKAQPAAR